VPSTDAFHQEYLNALAQLVKPKEEQNKGWGDRTLGWLCDRYMASDYFKSLAAASQAGRKSDYDAICRERFDKAHVYGHLPIAAIVKKAGMHRDTQTAQTQSGITGSS
jgi:hypothetical protein